LKEPRLIEVDLSKLFLDPENPRFEPVRDEAEAITELCSTEHVLAVAESIAADGLNPLELTAVTEVKAQDGKATGTYVVREGNRRVGAMKLLKDPSKAPAKQQASFRKLSNERVPKLVPVMLFDKKEDIDPWLKLLHQRDQNPAARRGWTADQQARAFGGTRNQKAMYLTDVAVAEGWIEKADRRRTLSIVDRWISNPKLRLHIGVKFVRGSDEVEFITAEAKQGSKIKEFFRQVAEKEINTRANKKEIEAWVQLQSKDVNLEQDASTEEVEKKTESAHQSASNRKSPPHAKPRPPLHEKLPFNQAIEAALSRLGNQKLEALYHELCITNLGSVQLLCIGWWAFMTTLCSVVQGTPSDSFASFLSHDRMVKIGFGHRDHRKNLMKALESIASNGNTAKHATTATLLNGAQLYNDVQTIEEVVIALLEVLNKDRAPVGVWP
jgi:uncharacterized membrane protein YkoI